MNDKKMSLIKSGVKLVAAKGYHNTSIQEIAKEAGVSKGAFYLYFQSKEEFLATAYLDFKKQLERRYEKVKQENHPPEKSLEKQIGILIEYIYSYKDFIIIHLRESISIGDHTDKVMKQFKMENFHWMKDNIQNIYGDQVNDLIVDAVIQFEGLLSSYLKWIIVDDVHISSDKLSGFLVRRLNDVVYGMLASNEESAVTTTAIPLEYLMQNQTVETMLSTQLESAKEKIRALDLDSATVEQLEEVASAIEKEAVKKEAQPVVIQGLLSHFTRIPELREESEQIAELLDVELLV
ncbi:AcrR family transcriptional regulator [Virgibacillus natechei]|uniref:AcrR family transcriptional regulator n=1 Tax=Virgibacillus natechei TaxID=1216297 RepID=A0ABS4IN00_9BACI|nr:TetR/AcrR family transcriptional regulator [Virgibacillus natechei]MBP1971676.1 AcrR family transcriptional regulator [Virgibacillus natechei]UZD12566.1 TetR/AcrR family transcriptional regulator [Virgibacillus natechei]